MINVQEDDHLELVHTDPAVYANFQHIQDPSVIHPYKSQTVRSFFCSLANDKQRCIIFGCPEFEGCSRIRVGVKRAYVVLLVKRDSVRPLERDLHIL